MGGQLLEIWVFPMIITILHKTYSFTIFAANPKFTWYNFCHNHATWPTAFKVPTSSTIHHNSFTVALFSTSFTISPNAFIQLNSLNSFRQMPSHALTRSLIQVSALTCPRSFHHSDWPHPFYHSGQCPRMPFPVPSFRPTSPIQMFNLTCSTTLTQIPSHDFA